MMNNNPRSQWRNTASNDLDSGYVMTNDFGQRIPFNPNQPNSPFSVNMDQQTQQQMGLEPMHPVDLPETLTQRIYLPGFLRTNIGALMRVEFLIGNTITDRVGVLNEVGASYIVLQSLDLGSSIVCDLFAIKFVTILRSESGRELMEAFR